MDFKVKRTDSDYLEHHGVKGQRWGVRHDKPRSGASRTKSSNTTRVVSSKGSKSSFAEQIRRNSSLTGALSSGAQSALNFGNPSNALSLKDQKKYVDHLKNSYEKLRSSNNKEILAGSENFVNSVSWSTGQTGIFGKKENFTLQLADVNSLRLTESFSYAPIEMYDTLNTAKYYVENGKVYADYYNHGTLDPDRPDEYVSIVDSGHHILVADVDLDEEKKQCEAYVKAEALYKKSLKEETDKALNMIKNKISSLTQKRVSSAKPDSSNKKRISSR